MENNRIRCFTIPFCKEFSVHNLVYKTKIGGLILAGITRHKEKPVFIFSGVFLSVTTCANRVWLHRNIQSEHDLKSRTIEQYLDYNIMVIKTLKRFPGILEAKKKRFTLQKHVRIPSNI